MAGAYRIYMDGRDECLGWEDHLLRERQGSFLLAFLDQDWEALADQAQALRRQAFHMEQMYAGYRRLREEFQEAHPLFRQELDRMADSADSLYAAGQWAGEMGRFRRLMAAAVERVLDRDTGAGGAGGRYRQLLEEVSELSRLADRLHEGVGVQYAFDSGQGQLCLTARDLRALLFLSFEYLVSQGYALGRCLNCGRYFVPFSVNTCYCDRPVGEGRTCKTAAAKVNYTKKLRQDQARSLYARQNNTYQMRVRRSPERYPEEEYRLWRQQAKELLAATERGELSWEEFQRKMELPRRRGGEERDVWNGK